MRVSPQVQRQYVHAVRLCRSLAEKNILMESRYIQLAREDCNEFTNAGLKNRVSTVSPTIGFSQPYAAITPFLGLKR